MDTRAEKVAPWLIVLALCIMYGIWNGVTAAEAPVAPLHIALHQFVVVPPQDEEGDEQLVPFDDDAAVKPGTIIEYRLAITNVADESIADIVISPQLPDGATYVSGSANPNDPAFLLQFSIDGGQTFRVPPIRHAVTEPDGTVVEKVATPDLYTDMRIALLRPLEPGEHVGFSYRMAVD